MTTATQHFRAHVEMFLWVLTHQHEYLITLDLAKPYKVELLGQIVQNLIKPTQVKQEFYFSFVTLW